MLFRKRRTATAVAARAPGSREDSGDGIRSVTFTTWPNHGRSLALDAVEAALGRPVASRRGSGVGARLIEYENYPEGIVRLFETALAAGRAEDSPEGFSRFASEEFAGFKTFRDQDAPGVVMLPRAGFRADPGAYLAQIAVLAGIDLPPGKALDRLVGAMKAWLARQPAADVTAFRHYDAELFGHLGTLSLSRQVVQDTFREVMKRDLEDKGVIVFQACPSRLRLKQILMNSQEYRTRHGIPATAPFDEVEPPPPVLIHLHVPKSAGTSLNTILASNFRREEKLALEYAQLDRLEKLPAPALSRLRLVFGHLPHGIGAHIDREVLYVCALREPGPRLLSYYRYMKRNKDHPLYRSLNETDMSFGGFLDYCIANPEQRPEADNGQMRRIAGRLAPVDLGNEEAIFRQALRNVFAPDMVFGLTERVEDLLVELVSRGLIRHYETVVANAAPEIASFDDARNALTASQRKTLDAFLRWDKKLYDICKAYLYGLDRLI